jgi:hypothetical protein
VPDCDRKAVEAAEAFADGAMGGDVLRAAWKAGCASLWPNAEGHLVVQACAAMLETTVAPSASAVYRVVPRVLSALPQQDRPANKRRICELLRDIFGNPFRPLRQQAFPAHVVALARECYDAFPIVSDRFLILADALADLGEEQAAEHCRQPEHAKGCHVLDAILGRSWPA